VLSLVVRDGPLAGTRVEVAGELTVGRIDADITLDDDEVSRRHALLRAVDGGIEVEDAGSTNGTFVNDVRIGGPTRLLAGDRVRFGLVTLEVEAAAVVDPLATRISAPAASETMLAPAEPSTAVPAAPVEPSRVEPSRAEPATAQPRPAPAPPPPAAPLAPAPAAAAPVAPFAPPGGRRRHGIATRTLAPTAFALAAIAATAVALLVYFAVR
jgi:pSer/pThr/pTyr-binding forkhead associated (FHA) protein